MTTKLRRAQAHSVVGRAVECGAKSRAVRCQSQTAERTEVWPRRTNHSGHSPWRPSTARLPLLRLPWPLRENRRCDGVTSLLPTHGTLRCALRDSNSTPPTPQATRLLKRRRQNSAVRPKQWTARCGGVRGSTRACPAAAGGDAAAVGAALSGSGRSGPKWDWPLSGSGTKWGWPLSGSGPSPKREWP